MIFSPAIFTNPFISESNRVFRAFDVPCSYARKRSIDGLVRKLKADGVWPTLDALYVWAHDRQAARVNIRTPGAYDLAEVPGAGILSFAANVGFTSDGVSYLNTAFNPATAGGLFALDSNHAGIWSETDSQTDNASFGNGNAFLAPRNTGNNFSSRNSSSTSTSNANAGSGAGHFAMSRLASTEYKKHQGGALHSTVAVVSSALTSASFVVLGRSSAFISTKTIGAVHWGAGIDDTKMAALYAALAAYRAAL